MFKQIVLSLGLLLISYNSTLNAKTLVRVGVYDFPPYVQVNGKQLSGFTSQLLAALNQTQQQYHFTPVLTTAMRRHQDFQQGLFDALFFEDADWGWNQRNIALQQSAPFASDEEVFIALLSHAQSQYWFNDLSGKTIAGILGYHYNLANYQTAPELLANQYQLVSVTDHDISIELVIKQRVDLAIVTRSFLFQYLNRRPQYRKTLIISERVDQRYQHQILLHPEHPLPINTLHQWVYELLQKPEFNQVFSEYGLQLIPYLAEEG